MSKTTRRGFVKCAVVVAGGLCAATASGGVLDVPEGVYMVDQVRVSARSADANGEQTTRLRLIGRGESSVIRSRVAGELVYIGNAGGNEIADIELRDLTIDGANLATIGVRLALSRRVRFAGVRIVRSAGDGFSIGDAAIGRNDGVADDLERHVALRSP